MGRTSQDNTGGRREVTEVRENKEHTKPIKKLKEKKAAHLISMENSENLEYAEPLDINVSINEGIKGESRIEESKRRIDIGGTSFPCDFCGKDFSTNSRMKVHRLVHTGEKPFKCTQCDKTFNQSANLSTHIKKYHAN